MVLLKLFVRWEGDHPVWILDIEDSKTILELKQMIAKHYNYTYTGFNIINGDDTIDSSKNNCTLKECGIKRMIRLAENYDPAHFYNLISFEQNN